MKKQIVNCTELSLRNNQIRIAQQGVPVHYKISDRHRAILDARRTGGKK